MSSPRPSSVPVNEDGSVSARPASGNDASNKSSRSKPQRTPQSARGSGPGEFVSRLDSLHHDSIFGNVIQAVKEVAKVKKSDPTHWIRDLEKDYAKLKAYCIRMEDLDDEMLLRRVNDHSKSYHPNHIVHDYLADHRPNTAEGHPEFYIVL